MCWVRTILALSIKACARGVEPVWAWTGLRSNGPTFCLARPAMWWSGHQHSAWPSPPCDGALAQFRLVPIPAQPCLGSAQFRLPSPLFILLENKKQTKNYVLHASLYSAAKRIINTRHNLPGTRSLILVQGKQDQNWMDTVHDGLPRTRFSWGLNCLQLADKSSSSPCLDFSFWCLQN